MTMDSRAAKRWMLGMAASFALLGLVLKLTDLRGRADAQRRAGESASVRRGEGATPLAGEADRRAGQTSFPSGGDERGGIRSDADHGAATVPRLGDTEGRARFTREESLGGHGRARGRARMLASREAGSLTASTVGDEASGERAPSAGAGAHEPRAGEMVARNNQAGATDTRAAEAADVAFDGGDAQYQTEAQVEVPDVGKITGAAGTMSLWMQPGWQEGNQDDATLMNLGDGRLQIIKNVGFLRFEFVDDGGNAGGIGSSIAEWREGEWHQVTAVWNGNQYSLYVDGQLVSQTVHDGRVDLPSDAKLYIGSSFPEGRPVAHGTIGSVDLHNRPLGPGEVAGNFHAVAGRSTARATP